MARAHGRILTSIWAPGSGFTDLTELEQRAYMMALSQPSLTYAGVLPYTLRRWEGLARDSSIARLRKAFNALQTRIYVLVDEDTEEMFLRSFVKNDGILGNPNVARASVKDFDAIHSPAIRGAFLGELTRLSLDPERGSGDNKGWGPLGELLSQPLPEGYPQCLDKCSPEWSEYARAAPMYLPLNAYPTACAHGSEEPSRCALCRHAANGATKISA